MTTGSEKGLEEDQDHEEPSTSRSIATSADPPQAPVTYPEPIAGPSRESRPPIDVAYPEPIAGPSRESRPPFEDVAYPEPVAGPSRDSRPPVEDASDALESIGQTPRGSVSATSERTVRGVDSSANDEWKSWQMKPHSVTFETEETFEDQQSRRGWQQVRSEDAKSWTAGDDDDDDDSDWEHIERTEVIEDGQDVKRPRFQASRVLSTSKFMDLVSPGREATEDLVRAHQSWKDGRFGKRKSYAHQYQLPDGRQYRHINKLAKLTASELEMNIFQDKKLLQDTYLYRRIFLRKLELPEESFEIVDREDASLATESTQMVDSSKPTETSPEQGPRISRRMAEKVAAFNEAILRRKVIRESEAMQMPHNEESQMSPESSRDADVSDSLTDQLNSSSSNNQSPTDSSPGARIELTGYTYREIEHRSCLGCSDKVIVAKSRASQETFAIRVRTGTSGYSEWMNELQVYLLPNFSHKNILDCYGTDQQYNSNQLPKIDEFFKSKQEGADGSARARSYRLEYWLMNKYDECQTLREYLKSRTLSWPQMISIARDIMQGLSFLHDNIDYQNLDLDKAIDGFIQSTNGALKKVAFLEHRTAIYLHPHPCISVIHRNLTSLNVVLKSDLTACIWNFGLSHIHHPFQPTNYEHIIDSASKDVHRKSQYSPPEVLQGKGHLTIAAMRNIDIYASGVLFWELISRCVLPTLDCATDEEHRERAEPEEYSEPFEKEFGEHPSMAMLEYAVCKVRARPRIKRAWLLGKKSNRFVQTIQDLWDQDFEARLHPSTVIDRLNQTSLANTDKRNKYSHRTGKTFDLNSMWPPEFECTQAPPYPDKCGPNIVVEELPAIQPLRPAVESSDSNTNHTSTATQTDAISFIVASRALSQLGPRTSSPLKLRRSQRTTKSVYRRHSTGETIELSPRRAQQTRLEPGQITWREFLSFQQRPGSSSTPTKRSILKKKRSHKR